jgi:hypothetical protein
MRGCHPQRLCPKLCPLDRGKHGDFLSISLKADSEKPFAFGKEGIAIAQVPFSRILTVCGEVAEWPKAAVC